MTKQLLTAQDIADLCSVSPRTVAERWALRPDFPEPVYLPSGKAGRARKRWRKIDIYRMLGLSADSRTLQANDN